MENDLINKITNPLNGVGVMVIYVASALTNSNQFNDDEFSSLDNSEKIHEKPCVDVVTFDLPTNDEIIFLNPNDLEFEQRALANFASRMVANSRDIDPDIHEYVQKNFSKLLL